MLKGKNSNKEYLPENNNDAFKLLGLHKKIQPVEYSPTAVNDKIELKKEEIAIKKIFIEDALEKLISYLIFITLLTSANRALLKDIKETSYNYKYKTYSEIYLYNDESLKKTVTYEDIIYPEEKTLIRVYYPWKEYDDKKGIIEIENYNVSDMDYNYVINNVEEIVNWMGDENTHDCEFLPITTLLTSQKFDKVYYEVVRTIQDQDDFIALENKNKKVLIGALFIFIEMVLYAKFIDLNEGLLIVSVWKQIKEILINKKMMKEDISELDKYEEMYYEMYIRDLMIHDLIDEVSNNQMDKMGSQKIKIKKKDNQYS